MKTLKSIIAASIAVTILFSSCSVEKRRYRKGYNVETKAKKQKAEEKKVDVAVATEPATTPAQPQQPVAVDQSATTMKNGTNNEYQFSVKIGPRPDKKRVQAKHRPK